MGVGPSRLWLPVHEDQEVTAFLQISWLLLFFYELLNGFEPLPW